MNNTPTTENDTRLALTVKQFAFQMQISMPTAYSMVNSPGFPRLMAGKKILIPTAALDRWIDEQVNGEKAREQWKND